MANTITTTIIATAFPAVVAAAALSLSMGVIRH
jgi:hypothetical protein